MTLQPTLVLTAVVSPDERRILESNLEQDGFEVRGVDDARTAECEIVGHAGSRVLLIDSGLMLMPHDPQWRSLRMRQPHLGAVIRSLLREYPAIEAGAERTILIHPDDHEGLVQAIRALEGSSALD